MGEAGQHTSDGSQGFFVEELSGMQIVKTTFRINGPGTEVAPLGWEVGGPAYSPDAAGCELAWRRWNKMV